MKDELAKVAKRYHAARQREWMVRHELHEAIVDAVTLGMSEVEAAQIAGVDRGTVRRALGKSRH